MEHIKFPYYFEVGFDVIGKTGYWRVGVGSRKNHLLSSQNFDSWLSQDHHDFFMILSHHPRQAFGFLTILKVVLMVLVKLCME